MPSAPSLPTSSATRAAPSRRRMFGIGRMFKFRIPPRLVDAIIAGFTCLADGLVYVLGPILICFALVIASGLTYCFFQVVLPMLQRAHKDSPYLNIILGCHISYVVAVLINALYNYALCVMTSNKGPNYERVVRELAEATDFWYPDTPAEVKDWERDYTERMLFRMERRKARADASSTRTKSSATTNNNDSTMTHRKTGPANNRSDSDPSAGAQPTTRPRSWMLMGPHEWGFCTYSQQPKPPRAHYDHVTKTLVLNMDHYCPWMFNTIGYFNYRYFCNFLFFVFIGMFYGAILTLKPFKELHGREYYKQMREARANGHSVEHLYPWTPTPGESTPIAFCFMLCLSLGLAVLCLGGFHAYLLLTAQTTIEFHGNSANRRKAKRQRRTWVNPYDLGMTRNWQQVYGSANPLLAILVPSSRQPEFLPVPLAGDRGRRHPKDDSEANADGRTVRQNRGPDVV